jgi:hypothetical protein
VYDEEAPVIADNRRAFWPKDLHLFQPGHDRLAEAAVERVFGCPELLIQAARTDEGYPSGLALNGPAFPNKP